MKRFTSLVLATAISFGVIPSKSSANPAVLAPAVCATGIGCILLGTIAAGGIVYYVWNSGGERVVTDATGSILRMLDAPEDFEKEEQHETSGTRDMDYAEKKCKADAAGRKYLYKYRDKNGVFVCVFR